MTIFGRYITREIVKSFGIILMVVTGIYLTVDFIEKIDNFIDAGLPLLRALLFFVYKLPLILVQITPVGMLLAVIITFGLMAKNNELLALRASGVSLVSLLGSIVWCGVASTLFIFLVAEAVMPLTIPQADQIWFEEVKGRKTANIHRSDIWLKGNETVLHVKYFDPAAKVAKGITIHRFDDRFSLTERIDAATGVFGDGRWVLSNGLIQKQGDRYTVQPFDQMEVPLDFAPEDLVQLAPKPEAMSFVQLYRYVRKVEAEGYDATHYRVDLHAKVAFPAISLILALIGAGLAARGKIKEAVAGSVTYGLGLAFLYWIAFSFSLSLGYAGKLPPIVAAWGVNFISICVAGYLLVNAD
jgi:lipopolysaccharide export system permease protein